MMNIELSGTLPKINDDLKSAMSKIKEDMKASILLNFEEGGRPVKWLPLKRTGKPSHLTKTGALKSSITSDSGDNWATAGTSKAKIIYSAVHQFGYEVRNIPMRRYIMFQEADKENIKKIILDETIKFSEPIRANQ